MKQGMSLGRWAWLGQAVSGILLVVLIALHWVAQHWVASGGVRSYADVVAYLRRPEILALETAFLVVVTAHALLGVRAILLDLGPDRRARRLLNLGLGTLGLATVGYGLALTLTIIR